MMNRNEEAARRGARPFRVLGVAALAIGALAWAGCDNPLDVTDPDIVEPEAIDNPAGLESQRLGAFGDFALAYSGDDGGDEGFVLLTGLMADEFIHSGTFPERTQYDARQITSTSVLVDFYSNLHRARRAAESTAAGIQASAEADPVGLAQMNSLAGYTYIFFGEMFCSGVPFSEVTEAGELVFGQPQTTEQIFNTAISRFDAAAAAANAAGAAGATLQSLAAVGKARALLDLNQPNAAATAVAAVTDPAFLYQIQHSINSGRQENGIFVFVSLSERWSVANSEGTNGLPFRDIFTAGDPRTPWTVLGDPGDLGFDQTTLQFDQLKYPGRDEPSTLASYAEAKLIEAEAFLRAGNTGAWLGILNDLRATIGLAALADPGSQAARVDLHFAERAYWLWLTGHRLGDMRRLVRQYGRAPNTVYPAGPYPKTFASYGTNLVFPIPLQERNNPNAPQQGLVYATCLNANA